MYIFQTLLLRELSIFISVAASKIIFKHL